MVEYMLKITKARELYEKKIIISDHDPIIADFDINVIGKYHNHAENAGCPG